MRSFIVTTQDPDGFILYLTSVAGRILQLRICPLGLVEELPPDRFRLLQEALRQPRIQALVWPADSLDEAAAIAKRYVGLGLSKPMYGGPIGHIAACVVFMGSIVIRDPQAIDLHLGADVIPINPRCVFMAPNSTFPVDAEQLAYTALNSYPQLVGAVPALAMNPASRSLREIPPPHP